MIGPLFSCSSRYLKSSITTYLFLHDVRNPFAQCHCRRKIYGLKQREGPYDVEGTHQVVSILTVPSKVGSVPSEWIMRGALVSRKTVSLH